MGVPTLFRWFRDRYPQILKNTDSNPVIDNLYIDMNGLIHPCFHPQNRQAPKNYNEVFQEIFIYLDKVIQQVNPRKLVYLAIDGVAPRAKMNQQRLRRYNAAFDNQYKKDTEHQQEQQQENNEQDIMDSNLITPGTPFMKRLEKQVEQYIASRQSDKFQNLTFIFSPSNVPGEGEHKIMNWIRIQRQQQYYNPETTHCLHGLDADLIFLALCSHEPNFYIFREIVLPKQDEIVCKKCGQIILKNSPHAAQCPYELQPPVPVVETKHFQFLSIGLLRQCLQHEFNIYDSYKCERIITDFTFICFAAGNDFIPTILCLNINDNGIIRIIKAYKLYYQQTNQFMVEKDHVKYDMLLVFLQIIVQDEPGILKSHQNKFDRNQDRYRNIALTEVQQQLNDINIQKYTEEEQNKLREQEQQLLTKSQLQIDAEKRNNYSNQLTDPDKLKITYIFRDVDYYQNFQDLRRQYYYDNSQSVINGMCLDYLMVMQWICTYYTSYQKDVTTFYHYYQAPLMSDMVLYLSQNMQYIKQQQTLLLQKKEDKNLLPYQQLLAVLPEVSIKRIGGILYTMQQQIKDQYQTHFDVDLTMCSMFHQGIVKLNFIDVEKIQQVYEQNKSNMTQQELEQNMVEQASIYGTLSTQQGKFEQLMIQDSYQIRNSFKIQKSKSGQNIYIIQTCQYCYAGAYKRDTNSNMINQQFQIQLGQDIYEKYKINKQYKCQSVYMKYVPLAFNINIDPAVIRARYQTYNFDKEEWNRTASRRNQQDQQVYDEIRYNQNIQTNKQDQSFAQYNQNIYQQNAQREYHPGQRFVPGRKNTFGKFVNK